MAFPGFLAAGVCPWCSYSPEKDQARLSAGDYHPDRCGCSCPACGFIWQERYHRSRRKYTHGALMFIMILRLPSGISPQMFSWRDWQARKLLASYKAERKLAEMRDEE